MPPVTRMSITLDPALVDQVRELAHREGITVAEYIRRALAERIERKES